MIEIALGYPSVSQHLQHEPQHFFKLAERHNLAPLLAYRLSQNGMICRLDQNTRARLLASLMKSQRNSENLIRELSHTSATLRSQSVRYLVWKGCATETQHYPAIGTRPSGDIDLFIHGRDLVKIHRLLTLNGYTGVYCRGSVSFRSRLMKDGLNAKL
jgi:hypothetical protein